MRGGALTNPAETPGIVTVAGVYPPSAGGNPPAPHNRALRQNQDSRSSVVRPLRRHSKFRPTHHRSGENRNTSGLRSRYGRPARDSGF